MKRLFDVVASSCGLIALSPLFIGVSIWIKLDSDGEVFFRQERVGKNGKIFKIHKFRTMATNAYANGGGLTVGDDNRITRAGHLLRKFKIDELPQLIDVLEGNMSIVGPRPEISEFMDLYSDKDKQKILSVKPGITDKASIELINENEILAQYENPRQAYIDIIMPLKAKYYIDYVNNQSLKGDIEIILKTLAKIISKWIPQKFVYEVILSYRSLNVLIVDKWLEILNFSIFDCDPSHKLY